MKTLVLPVKGTYFNQIKAGTKTEEYRRRNDHWRMRLEGRGFDSIVIAHGYPSSADSERRIELPWRGYTVKTITHEHFGLGPVEVYAIHLATQFAAPAAEPVPGRVYLVAVDDELREQRCFSMRLEDGWSICMDSPTHALQCRARTVRSVTRVIRPATAGELGLATDLAGKGAA